MLLTLTLLRPASLVELLELQLAQPLGLKLGCSAGGPLRPLAGGLGGPLMTRWGRSAGSAFH
jgi:hypothetical protein